LNSIAGQHSPSEFHCSPHSQRNQSNASH
jgi:hypothetical protein